MFTKQSGFTLVELMIAVGIIGVVISIAVPKYTLYQGRARQAEAKLSLSGIYSLEKSFYSEYSAYIPYVDAIGFEPDAQTTYYNTGFAHTMGGWGNSVTGFTGNVSLAYWDRTISSNAFNEPCPGICMPGSSDDCGLELVSDWCPTRAQSPFNQNDPQQFSACAGGQVVPSETDRKCDYWQITERKRLTNFQSGFR